MDRPFCNTSFSKRLNCAALKGDSITIHKMLLEHPGNDSERKKQASTALHFAVRSGDKEAASALLQHGADPNVGFSSRRTFATITEYPLVRVAASQDLSMLELLLSAGANPNVQEQNSTACYGSPEETVAGQSALHEAVTFANVEMVRILLEYGSRTDLRNKKGETPIHCVFDGEQHELGCILDDGQNCNKCEKRCLILQMLCQSSKFPYQLNLLNKRGVSPLYLASECGSLDKLKILLDAGANPNEPLFVEWRYITPLWIAIRNRFPKIVILLVQSGADVNMIKDERSMLPSCFVCLLLLKRTSSLYLLCKLLIYAGCKLDRRNLHRHPGQDVICDWLRTMRSNPLSLQDLSRIAVRRNIQFAGKRFVGQIEQLPIPLIMKGFLLLNDILDDGQDRTSK